MPRKRKVKVIEAIEEEKENEDESTMVSQNATISNGPMYTIMSNVQLNETFHKKYIKEMQQLYGKMDHDAFLFTFIKMIKSAMEAEESNEYAHMTLIFCAKYASSYGGEDTHILLIGTFKWVLSTISHNPHIRFRLCQFINMLLNSLGTEAALDDNICDEIMSYMIKRLTDISPHVRLQAILALQRLQCPDNPDDPVLRAYQFHLCSDPSPKVRQSVITAMGRNYNTIPYILERLWDIDEKVRRHTYLHMSSYPVRAYKVVQRLTLLEQGLSDRSEMVKKVVTTVMLPQWLECYQKDYIALVSAFKLDSNEAEVERFKKITKVALVEIFKREKVEDLLSSVPIDPEGEFEKCVNYDKLTLETVIYWNCLIEYLQPHMSDELEQIIPELSMFCSYVSKFCEMQKPDMDKFEKMEFHFILLSLIEIIQTYDLGDEIGRGNLKILISTLIKNYDIDEKIVTNLVKCSENLFSEPEIKLEFYVAIINEILDSTSFKKSDLMNASLIDELLEKHPDKDIKLKISSLKVRLLDLEEQEMNFVEKKDYVQAQKIAEEKSAVTEEYTNVLKPLMQEPSTSNTRKSLGISKKTTNETITKCLQLSFYMVLSENVKALTPNVCALYKEFIRRHIESQHISIRDWALKCGTAYSMLYEQLAKDVYVELHSQFYKNHHIRIWKTAIECIFELLDRYGFEAFESDDKQGRSKKGGRQLYNTLEAIDAEEEASTSVSGNGLDLIYVMSHFLDTCDDVCIINSLVSGFCRLVLHGHIDNADIIEKLLLKYFNPATDNGVNQIIGVFLENLILKRKQKYLQPCLLPTVSTILSAPYDSPLQEIKPDTVLRFVIDSTRPQFCSSGENIHNEIALSFMREMQNNITNKELCKILSKELATLEISNNSGLKADLKGFCEKLLACELDQKVIKNISTFQDVLNGLFISDKRTINPEGSDAENADEKSDDESDGKSTKTITESMVTEETSSVTAATIAPSESTQCGTPTAAANKSVVVVTPRRNGQISPQKTPTTFGRENTTSLRYLRKSLNPRESVDEAPPRTPLIRIETRTDSDAEPTPKKSTPSKEPDLDKSDVILPSPTAESSGIHTRKERLRNNKTLNTSQARSTRNTRQNLTIDVIDTTEKSKSRKRPLRMSMSPRVTASFNDQGEERISPLRKQSKRNSLTSEAPSIAIQTSYDNISATKVRNKDNIENITPPRVSGSSSSSNESTSTDASSSTERKQPTTKSKEANKTTTPNKSTPTIDSPRNTRNTSRVVAEQTVRMTRNRVSLGKSDANTTQKKVATPVGPKKILAVPKVSKIPVNIGSKYKTNSQPILKKVPTTTTTDKEARTKSLVSSDGSKKDSSSTATTAKDNKSSTTSSSALPRKIIRSNLTTNSTSKLPTRSTLIERTTRAISLRKRKA